MNPFATAALVVIAVAQMTMASGTFEIPPEDVHFRVVQEFCKKETAREKSGRFVSVCGVCGPAYEVLGTQKHQRC
jgi:hypothetical protein